MVHHGLLSFPFIYLATHHSKGDLPESTMMGLQLSQHVHVGSTQACSCGHISACTRSHASAATCAVVLPQVCAGRINWNPENGEWVDTGCAISPVSDRHTRGSYSVTQIRCTP